MYVHASMHARQTDVRYGLAYPHRPGEHGFDVIEFVRDDDKDAVASLHLIGTFDEMLELANRIIRAVTDVQTHLAEQAASEEVAA